MEEKTEIQFGCCYKSSRAKESLYSPALDRDDMYIRIQEKKKEETSSFLA
jgi:hypothetical protein